MLRKVAESLGPELREQVAFVGGCTTGLLLTDAFTREQVRSTDDVDLIISVMTYASLQRFKETLKAHGFREPSSMDDMPICAMKLGELRVDLMPDNDEVLGFSNQWYPQALQTAEAISLGGNLSIRVVTPPLFVATKLEAYKGRGNGDPLESHDIEDILNLVENVFNIVAFQWVTVAAPLVGLQFSRDKQWRRNHSNREIATQRDGFCRLQCLWIPLIAEAQHFVVIRHQVHPQLA